MFRLTQIPAHVVELDRANGASLTIPVATSPWKGAGVFSLCLLLLTTSILAFYSAYEIDRLRDQVEAQATLMNERWQKLDAAIGFETKLETRLHEDVD